MLLWSTIPCVCTIGVKHPLLEPRLWYTVTDENTYAATTHFADFAIGAAGWLRVAHSARG